MHACSEKGTWATKRMKCCVLLGRGHTKVHYTNARRNNRIITTCREKIIESSYTQLFYMRVARWE